ncbi:MAG: hypothetical protein IPN29_03970 [Saprospiraceae bacterium]|nr:hypothetical protein [Saprospiraceae bacterium]
MKSKIRIGLLLDGYQVPSWVYDVIKILVDSEYAEIDLVVIKKEAVSYRNIFRKVFDLFPSILFIAYGKLENYLFKVQNDAFILKDLRGLLSTVSTLSVECKKYAYSDYLHKKDVENIRCHDLDIILRFGFRILRGEVLNTAKAGIWSLHHGDNLVNRGGPAGFWEVFSHWREVGSVLQILSENLDGGLVLARTWSAVDNSLKRTRNNFYLKTINLIPRKVKEYRELGHDKFMEKHNSLNSELNFYSNILYKGPGNLRLIFLITRHYFRWLRSKLYYLFFDEQWTLFYNFEPPGNIQTSLFRYKKIPINIDRFWADPFVIYKDDKYYIFFEEFLYKNQSGKGHISLLEIDKNGTLSRSEVVLQKPYHLSYPFVMEHKGNFYMIPESSEHKTIELYKARNFPHEWEFEMNLMENLSAFDSTILFHHNKFWLFTNICEIPGSSSNEELFLFFSDELNTNNWTPHPLNPIVSDVKRSRPAGKVLRFNDKIYRPSQDCSFRYGYSIQFSEIIKLTETEYEEELVTCILPSWDKRIMATHTFNADNGLTVIDAAVRRFRFFN